MKKILLSLVNLTFLYAASAEYSLDVKKQVGEVSLECSKHIHDANVLMGNPEQDLVTMFKELKMIGFGESPPPHPRHQPLTDEDKAAMSEQEVIERNDYVAGAKERVKRMGKEDVQFLKTLDANSDLKFSLEELESSIAKQLFDSLEAQFKVDQNQDSKLTLREYCLTVPAKGEVDENGADWHQRGHFKHEDADSDGFIDKQEFIQFTADDFYHRAKKLHLAAKLRSTDANKDQLVNKDEFQSLTKDEEHLKAFFKGEESVSHEQLWQHIYWMRVSTLTSLLD